MQTQSIGLMVQINYENTNGAPFTEDSLRNAIDLAFNPNFHSICGGTRITLVKVDDLEGGGEIITYGED